MSFFSGLFGAKSKQSIPTTQEAIVRLKETMELLEKKSNHIENKVQCEIQTAKENAKNNKKLALAALKRKKRLEKELQKIDGTIFSLEFQIEALEETGTNTVVLNAMRFASDALKKAQLDPDRAHDILDEIAEQRELQDEIGETLSCFTKNIAEFDEDELEEELAELENEGLAEEQSMPGEIHELPSVPETELSIKNKKKKMADDDSFKELASWAS